MGKEEGARNPRLSRTLSGFMKKRVSVADHVAAKHRTCCQFWAAKNRQAPRSDSDTSCQRFDLM